MTDDLDLPGKWTVKAHGKRLVVAKRAREKRSHVLMKALLWGLFLPSHPNLAVEVSLGLRYKPDLVALDALGQPVFWAEAGQVGVEKIRHLCRRYRHTHLVLAKWDTRLEPWVEIAHQALAGLQRGAPFELVNFPADSQERFISPRGELAIERRDLEWVTLGA
ncbi:MAG: YaeQ family protein [Candidatus Eremiobacteraeota bacterium]|nr:YaeQ family protein [Candidatus Eremiobacteraeota bacterium]